MSIAQFPRANPISVAAAPVVLTGVRTFDGMEQAEAVWRQLAPEATATPYQSFAWVSAWYDNAAPARGERPFIVGLFDAAGEALALLPLVLHRSGPFRTACPVGGSHANFHFGLFRRDALDALSAEQLRTALGVAAGRAGVDAYLLHQQAVSWEGMPNPLSQLGGIPSMERGRKTMLSPDGKAWIATNLSGSRRRMLRKKERWLNEIGDWRFVEAKTPAEVDCLIDAYQALKAEWFRRRGIANVFTQPGIDAFLRAAAKAGLDKGRPGIGVFGLEVAGELAAVIGGPADDERFCLMVTAADIDRFGRSSPGELLLVHLLGQSCDRGLKMFDLGVGEDAYKEHYCPDEEQLFDLALPVTARGRLLAAAWMAERRALGWAKRNPRIRAMAQRLRALRNHRMKSDTSEPNAAS
jgi:CelD/BcsL family acetyltransferase involved in cellulose biosynthesis